MKYRPAVDIVRLIASVSIVWVHIPYSPYKAIAFSGLSFFILLMFCLQGMSETQTHAFSLRKRAARLLTPWLIWSLFYALIKLMRFQPALGDFCANPGILLIGPEIHLWFLPFAFIGGVLGHFLLLLVVRLPRAWGLLFLCSLSTAFVAVKIFADKTVSEPFGQWAYAFPLLPVGLAIGLAQSLPARQHAFHELTVFAFTLIVSYLLGQPSYLLGVLALQLSILPKSHDIDALKWLANLSMGIYLLHPAVFLFIYKYAPAASWGVFLFIGVIGSAIVTGFLMLAPELSGPAFGIVNRPKQS